MVRDGRDKAAAFASTGGWTLGTNSTTGPYSSTKIIKPTPEQQAGVDAVSKRAQLAQAMTAALQGRNPLESLLAEGRSMER